MLSELQRSSGRPNQNRSSSSLRHPSIRHLSLRHPSLFHTSLRRLSLNVVFREWIRWNRPNFSTGPKSQCRSFTANDVLMSDGPKLGKADVQELGRQMQDGFSAESRRRQEDYTKMEEAMTAKMEEGFRNEQQARQHAQKEIMLGIKNEENAQMVQIVLQATKDKIRQLESGSGSGSIVVRSQYCRWKRAKRYFRKTISGSGRSAQRLFHAEKAGVQGLDHGLQTM